jgi:hypothetical protein
MPRNLTGVSPDPVSVRARVQAARADIRPTKATHQLGELHRLTGPVAHRHIKLVEDVVRGWGSYLPK